MTVLMSVAMPVWRHEAQREKEEELVFRGQQYVRAIRLYQAKTQALPPSIDVLVQGHYLRKKYKDPITNDDFVAIGAAGGAPGQVGQPGQLGQPVSRVAARQVRPAGDSTGTAASVADVSRSRSARRAVARRAASSASSARAPRNRFASIRAAPTTTSGTFVFVNAQPGGPGGPRRSALAVPAARPAGWPGRTRTTAAAAGAVRALAETPAAAGADIAATIIRPPGGQHRPGHLA